MVEPSRVEYFKADCITCRKEYLSQGCQHDGGECFNCRETLIHKMLALSSTTSFQRKRQAKLKREGFKNVHAHSTLPSFLLEPTKQEVINVESIN